MKDIKYFKYKNTHEFEKFLKEYGYGAAAAIGYDLAGNDRYHGNILKTYIIYFNNDDCEYFKVVYFKDFNEYHQSRLGFKGNKLLDGYQDSNVKIYMK